jgi:membrane protein DedA with SNARE-associated domain
MDNLWLSLITTLLAGVTGIYKGIPVGIAFGLSPFLTALTTSLGSSLAVIILYYSGSGLKQKIIKRAKRNKKKQTRFQNLLRRYGIPGLGIIGAGTIGPIPTVILGVLTKQPRQRFLPYLLLGIFLWSFALTFLASLGISQVQNLIY